MNPVRGSAVLVLIAGFVLLPGGSSASPPGNPGGYVPGRILIKLSGDLAAQTRSAGGGVGSTGSSALDGLIQRDGGQQVRPVFPNRPADPAALAARFPQRAARARTDGTAALENIFVLEVAANLDVEQLAHEYARVPGVVWAEPDRIAAAVLVPNDPFFPTSGSWGQPYRDLWGLVRIEAPAAWDVTRGAGVVVAISDTGIDALHPDIAARMWTNPGEIASNGIDDDGNGYADDIHGWDFFGNDADPFDDHGHGTHVAGTVAAVGDNGIGVVGVAFESSVMAVKGLGALGSGPHSALADGIIYAADNGADVINASWGNVGESQILIDAVKAAYDAGVVFVAAAGNDSSDASTFEPANVHQAIAVSALDHLDHRASFSNFGTKIDVGAPGGGDGPPPIQQPSRSILSLNSSGSVLDPIVASIYLRLSGTSMAAPHVSGVAALLLAAHPEYTPSQVRGALRVSADDLAPPGFDADAGYGRVNARKALLATNVLSVDITSPASGILGAGVITVTGTAAGPGFVDYTLEYGNPPFAQTIVGPIATPIENGVLGTWDVSAVPDGVHNLRLRARNTEGVSFEDHIQVRIDSVALISPVTDDVVGVAGSPIEVHGSAGGIGFQSYRVQYRMIQPDLTVGSWVSTGVSLTGGGTAPVTGLLATIDPAALPGPRDVDIRLRVDIGPFDWIDMVSHVVVDPTLRSGWPRRIAEPGFPASQSVTLADLDGAGGKEILLVANGKLFAIRADGSNLPGWPVTPLFGGYSLAPPSVADLDGNGSLEVVAPTGNGIDIRNADGSLLRSISVSGFPPAGTIAVADLNGDGARDLVFATRTAVRALRADGTSLPGFPITHACAASAPVRCFEPEVAVGDVDGAGDGRPEIALVANDVRRGTFLQIRGGNGALLDRFPKKMRVKQRIVDNVPIMVDVDGDGILEVAVNEDSRVTVYAGNGRKRRFPRHGKLPEFEVKGKPTLGSKQEPISGGDLDGDGLSELFVAQSYPETIFDRDGNLLTPFPPYQGQDYLIALSPNPDPLPGSWPKVFPYPQAEKAYGPGTAAIADIDGDGVQNAVVATGTCGFWSIDFVTGQDVRRCYTVHAFRHDGSLVPGFPKPTARAGKAQLSTPAIGDLDGDGLNEIVWINSLNDVLVWNVPGTPGPESVQWSQHRQGAAHTGALNVGP